MIYIQYVVLIVIVMIVTEIGMYYLFDAFDDLYQWFNKNRDRNDMIFKVIQISLSIYLGKRILGI